MTKASDPNVRAKDYIAEKKEVSSKIVPDICKGCVWGRHCGTKFMCAHRRCLKREINAMLGIKPAKE